ncbi:MAG: 30S ribosomal protein S20 [Planctomycetales bacterium]|nr:30S ribosomal protein S20 [Planctomycetales bacterium]
MPNTKGAKKRLRQSIVRRDRNRARKTRVRNSLTKFREAVAAKNFEAAKVLALSTTKLLDKAASNGLIHPNKAARLKSRMVHLMLTSQNAA